MVLSPFFFFLRCFVSFSILKFYFHILHHLNFPLSNEWKHCLIALKTFQHWHTHVMKGWMNFIIHIKSAIKRWNVYISGTYLQTSTSLTSSSCTTVRVHQFSEIDMVILHYRETSGRSNLLFWDLYTNDTKRKQD